MLTRRDAIKIALFSTAALTASRLPVWGQATPAIPAATGPFTLPPLPYAFDALEPYIDAQTMQLHHDKHHAAYVKNLNAAVAKMHHDDGVGGRVLFSSDPADYVRNLLTSPTFGITDQADPTFKAIRNNSGGHYNHSLFWQMMHPTPKLAQLTATPLTGTRPTKDMASAIDRQFGSFAHFQELFTAAALGQFGSGWAWLSLASDGTLKVESMPNQDSPLMLGRTPLLGIDVWEHAYYLKYQNRRAEYVAAWYNTVHWDFVNARFTQAKKAAPGL